MDGWRQRAEGEGRKRGASERAVSPPPLLSDRRISRDDDNCGVAKYASCAIWADCAGATSNLGVDVRVMAKQDLPRMAEDVSALSRDGRGGTLVGHFHVKRKVSFRRWPHLLLLPSFLCLFPHAQEPPSSRVNGRAAGRGRGRRRRCDGSLPIRTRMHTTI